MSKLWNIQQLRSSQPESRKDMLRFGLISGLSGLVLGFAAAFLETVIDDGGIWLSILSWLGEFFSRPGIWVFAAMLLAIFSKSSTAAMRQVGIFFAGRLLGYLLYGLAVSGDFSGESLPTGLLAALVAPVLAIPAGYSKGEGTAAVLIASLFAGLLLQQSIGMSLQFFYFKHLEELILFLLLLIVYRRPLKQTLLLAGASVVVAFLLESFGLFVE